MSEAAKRAEEIAEDFRDKYQPDDNGMSEIDVRDGTLRMTLEAGNCTTVSLTVPVEQADSKHIAEAFYEAASKYDPDEEFARAWSNAQEQPDLAPSKLIHMLQQDKTAIMIAAAQAMIDNGLDVWLDPDMPVLDVRMDMNDIAHMLEDGKIPLTPHNILEATQGKFPGKDGYILAGYTAQQGAELLKDIVARGRANEDYGFDMTQANQPEQKQPEHDAPTL